MTRSIIGLVGLIGSGKGTVSDYLVNNYGFITESYAKSVKDCVSSIFGWPRHLLEGDTQESRVFREQVDEWWSYALDIPNFTPRYMLQQFGTDIMREHFNREIWIHSVRKRILSSENNIVISDVRFPNEYNMIKDMGGSVILIKRGTDPQWLKDYVNLGIKPPDNIHESEYSWTTMDYNYIVYNDGNLPELYEQIDFYIK